MRGKLYFASLLFLLAFLAVPAKSAAPAAQVVDRIAARIEDDVITTSEMRELAAWQQLVDGHPQSDADLLSELIEQWVVKNEAANVLFPPAAKSDVDREVARIEGQSPNPQAYRQRLMQLGLTPEAVRRIVANQIFIARYLDYKFRTAVQVSDTEIENYYKQRLLPELADRKEPAPPLDQVRDQIRELLTQQAISKDANAWVDESKSRLRVEIEPGAGVPPDQVKQ